MTVDFQNEEEMLQMMAEQIHDQTGIVLNNEDVKTLLIEVQREQLKGLVYKAFLTVNQAAKEARDAAEASQGEQPALVEVTAK